MSPARRAVSLSTVAFVALAGLRLAGVSDGADLAIRAAVHGLSADALTAAMELVTRFGSVLVLSAFFLIALALFWRGAQGNAAKQLGATMLLAIMLENALKFSLQRARPEPFFGLVAPESYSFPSGHMLFATSFYGALALILLRSLRSNAARRAIWLVTIGLVVAIGFSRVYLGFHYASDVLAGLLAGVFCLAVVEIFLGDSG